MLIEAAILFPVIIMIFTALVLLSMYLPVRATLQSATQQAVIAMTTEKSDTWLRYNEDTLSFGRATSQPNVYAALGGSLFTSGDRAKAEKIVVNMEKRSLVKTPGTLTLEFGVVNYIIYKELTITATRSIPMPVDLTFIRFPRTLVITASSTAAVQDVDGFIRDLDMIWDVAEYLGLSPSALGFLFSAVSSLFGF